jgi:hypothetical protein
MYPDTTYSMAHPARRLNYPFAFFFCHGLESSFRFYLLPPHGGIFVLMSNDYQIVHIWARSWVVDPGSRRPPRLLPGWMNARAFGRDVAPLGREEGCHGLCPWGSTSGRNKRHFLSSIFQNEPMPEISEYTCKELEYAL